MTGRKEFVNWSPVARVDKFDDDQVNYVRRKTGLFTPQHRDFLHHGMKPWEVKEVEGNALTTSGLNRLTALLIGASALGMDSTRCRLGVGDDVTAFNASDTDLSTTTAQWYQVMDGTYPQQANGVATFKATVATGDGNFAWACWGLDLGTPTVSSSNTVSALLMNRKVAALGTKASGSWVLTVTLTFS